MTELLLKDSSDFASPAFWKKFFKLRKLPFEWYGDYETLGSALERYIKVGDKILQIGCGNSNFASELYENGFRNIHSIDIDERVIEDQKRKNTARSELTFSVESATNLSDCSSSKNLIIDKGTLDALLPPDHLDEQMKMVNQMFDEINRVLAPNGRYIVVTLAQKHILSAWLHYFYKSKNFLVEVHEIPTRAKGFCMPVFLFVAIKLHKKLPIEMPTSFLRNINNKVEKMSETALAETITSEQELSRFISMCSQKLTESMVIKMGEHPELGPRYTFTIVDNEAAKEIKVFSCFLVPIGKEGEWIFSNPTGRQCLLQQSESDRLMITFLNRKHTYANHQQIKDEINDFVARFDPRPEVGEINILSIGDIDARHKISSGDSEINGRWHVEEIDKEEYRTRQLVFDYNTALVQSEAFLKVVKDKYVLDLSLLSCAHHYMMLASLGLHASHPLRNMVNTELKIAVLGLGGGLLTTFILQHFPRTTVTSVELDKEMVKVATKYFGLPQNNNRLTIKVMDALDYISQSADGPKSAKLDVIFVDVAGSQDINGLSCPPAAFLEEQSLLNMKKCLRKNGVLAVNLVTRNKQIAEKYRNNIKTYFPKVYHLEAEEDINELLICVSTENDQNPDVLLNANHFLNKTTKAEWKDHVANCLEKIRYIS